MPLLLRSSPRYASFSLQRHHRPFSRPLRTQIRCEDEQEKENRFAEQLKRSGIEKEKAKEILSTWKEGGSKSPEQLRRMFIKGSIRPIAVVLLQLVLDAGATYGSFVFAASIGAAPSVPFPFVLSTLGTFAGFYFLTSTAADIVTLGTLLWSIYRFGMNTEAFLEALESIAGGSEIGVLNKAKKIVDAFKVIQALNKISDILKEQRTGEMTDLESLSGFLTLSHAEQNYGFEPEKYGLTEEEARNIAVVFSRYDRNDDGVLQISEIGSLVAELDTQMTDDELDAAMKMLDTDKSGVIEFEEFVDWWVNKVKPERAEVVES